jgi:hypothetical protein
MGITGLSIMLCAGYCAVTSLIRAFPMSRYRMRLGVPLDFNGEQAPNFESCVSLANATERYGVSKLKMHWGDHGARLAYAFGDAARA